MREGGACRTAMIVLIVMMGADTNVLFGEERGFYRTSLEFFSVDDGISCSCWLSILIQQKIRKQTFPRLLNWVAQRGMKSVYQKINMKPEQLKTEFNN